MKTLLEVGDTIKRFEVIKEIDIEYEIVSVTKTLAKTLSGKSFHRILYFGSTKPMPHYVAEVHEKTNKIHGTRFFLTDYSKTNN